MLTGSELKAKGINNAINSAVSVDADWYDNAYSIMQEFINLNNDKKFMCEDVRDFAKDKITQPPTNRAWGAIILRAKKDKLIKPCGFNQVVNPKAHMANASMWIKC